MGFKFGFIPLFVHSFVGADVPDGPFSSRQDLLSEKEYLWGVEVAKRHEGSE